ncbi:MAG: DUF2914 domain-containing protein [Chloroflexi bacterium]|nr:DUF2914 domain-containing protein [Chloroflexota bacterium]
MKKLLLFAVLLFWGLSAEAAEIKVIDGVITTAIKNQLPVDQIEVYPAGYGKLFCFTRIVGVQEETHVTHVWYYQDDELARVSLSVGSADWRTYSSKRFLPQWVGQWRVEVLDENGHELVTIPFELK